MAWIKVMHTGKAPIIALGQTLYPGETRELPQGEIDRLQQQYGDVLAVLTPLAVGEAPAPVNEEAGSEEEAPTAPFTVGEEPAPKQSKAHK